MLSLVSNSIRFQELRQAAFPNLQYITFLCFFTAFWTLQGKTQWDPEKQNMPLFSCWLGRDGPPVKPLIPYISKPLGSSTCGKFFSYISIYFKNIYWKNLHNFECNRKNTVKADSRSKKKSNTTSKTASPSFRADYASCYSRIAQSTWHMPPTETVTPSSSVAADASYSLAMHINE